MRAAVLTLLIATGLAAPALAQSDAAWMRERNAAAMEREAARRQAGDYEREARAREQRARTQETVRGLAPGELAGGPGAPSRYRPSAISPMPPPDRAPAAPLTPSADQARMDALIGDAMARSNARVRAVTGDGRR